MNYAAELRAVTKHFSGGDRTPRAPAVNNLTLGVAQGQIFGLLGLNGSGKSTTLKLLLGLLRPTQGECFVKGVPALDPLSRLHVGYAPESPRFPAHMTGREVVVYFGRMSGANEASLRESTERVLVAGGLAAAADQRVAHYSKGMLQRLGLAQALVHDPELLILDEPASGLDIEGVADLTARLRSLKAQGKTILLSSHHFNQVGAVCDRIALLDQGRCVFEGAVPELVAHPGWQNVLLENLTDSTLEVLHAQLASQGGRLGAITPALFELEDVIEEQLARVAKERAVR